MRTAPIAVGIFTAGLAAGAWYLSIPEKRAERALRRDDLPAAIEILSHALDRNISRGREEFLRARLAQTLLSREKYDLAEAQLLQLRRDFPKNAWAAMALGVIYADRGKNRFAREELEAAETLDPSDNRTLLALARLDYFDWEPAQAKTRLDAVLARDPRHRMARELLSYIYFDSGDYRGAAAELEALTLVTPQNKRIRSLLIQTFQNMGEWDKAEKLIAQIEDPEDAKTETALLAYSRGDWDQAQILLAEIHRRNPWDFSVAMHYAGILAARGRLSEARQIWTEMGERVRALESGSPDITWSNADAAVERSDFRLWLRRLRKDHALMGAGLAFRAKRLEDAADWSRKALAISPRDQNALANYAELARLQGDNKERLAWCEKAAALYGDHPTALLNRAVALIDLGRVDDAVKDAQRAAATYPHLAYAQGILAEAYLRLNKIPEGLEIAARGAMLNPFDARARLVLGMAQALDGKPDMAEENFRRVLLLDPTNARAHWELGRLLGFRGRAAESQKHSAEARKLEPMVYAQRKPR